MTFTIRHCIAWIALSFTGTVIVLLMFMGGWFTLIGLSLALNLYLGWHHYGHANMLLALGLQPSSTQG